jgi:hypothetical protein
MPIALTAAALPTLSYRSISLNRNSLRFLKPVCMGACARSAGILVVGTLLKQNLSIPYTASLQINDTEYSSRAHK